MYRMRAIYLSILCLFGFLSAQAQSTKLEWAKHNSGGQSAATDMAISDSGFLYVVGYFTDTVDFDPGPDTFFMVSAGDKDIFIQKLSPNGDLVWAKRMGGPGNDEVNAVAVDPLGNVYTTGSFVGTVDFNPGIATNNLTSTGGSLDIFVQKLTAAGNYVWAYRMGGAGTDIGRDLTVDATGAVYVTGSFVGTVNFNPGGTSNLTSSTPQFADIFVQKVSTTRVFAWARRVGGIGIDEALAITLDRAGNIYTTGYFSEVVDFDPGAGTDSLWAAPSRNVFIHKLTNAGNHLWARQLKGSLFASQGKGITTDHDHNVYLTGYFFATVDFDPGPDTLLFTSTGGSDPFVLKLDSAGGYIWARQITGIASNQGLAIAVDKEKYVYTTGFFSFTADFDPSNDNFDLTANGSASDVFVHKLDSTGQLVWARQVGASGADRGEAIAVDTLGNVYFAGSFSQTVDFDPTAGIAELVGDSISSFVAKWSPCTPTYATVDTAACYTFTSATGQFYTSSGTYTENILNTSGCDSIIIINLTINDTARHTITETACGSFELNGQTYDSTGIYTQLFTSAAGCDSILTLELIINPVPEASVTQIGDTLTATTTGATYQWLDCNNGYVAIAGAIHSTFVPMETGDYALAVTANGCTDTSACFNIIIIGVEEKAVGNFALYPNPNNGKFTIALGTQQAQVDVLIMNLAGQTVWLETLKNQSTIDLDLDLPSGVYLVSITTANSNKQVIKLVKE